VFRSLRALHVQIINDDLGVTLVAMSSDAASRKTKTEQASALGKAVAAQAQAAGITKVVFDRGGYAYHGRVAALAEGMRAGGLEF
jgi:large subunit ribosomal protein L18